MLEVDLDTQDRRRPVEDVQLSNEMLHRKDLGKLPAAKPNKDNILLTK